MAIENPNLISGGTIGIEAYKDMDGVSASDVTWKIPPRIGVITVSMALPSESGNLYRVEYTNSPNALVEAGTAKWFDAFGADQSTSRIVPLYGAVSAIRVTRVSGSGTFRAAIRGQ